MRPQVVSETGFKSMADAVMTVTLEPGIPYVLVGGWLGEPAFEGGELEHVPGQVGASSTPSSSKGAILAALTGCAHALLYICFSLLLPWHTSMHISAHTKC